MFGISLFNADGVCCYGTNTFIEEMDPERLEGEAEVTFAIESLDLVEGTYKLDVAVHTLRRLSLRLPSAALHLPRQVAHAATSASTVRGITGRFRPAYVSSRKHEQAVEHER